MMTSTKTGRSLPPPIGAYHPGEIRKRRLRISILSKKIRGYTKFMIMRNPMDRFQSAYFDKMERIFNKSDAHYKYLKWARRNVLQSVGAALNGSIPHVSFKTFVDFVLKQKGPARLLEDNHW